MWLFTVPLLRLTAGLFIAGALVALYQLRERARPQIVPASIGMTSCLEFYHGSSSISATPA